MKTNMRDILSVLHDTLHPIKIWDILKDFENLPKDMWRLIRGLKVLLDHTKPSKQSLIKSYGIIQPTENIAVLQSQLLH